MCRMYPVYSFDTGTDYCGWAFFESPAEYMDNLLGRTDKLYFKVQSHVVFVFKLLI